MPTDVGEPHAQTDQHGVLGQRDLAYRGGHPGQLTKATTFTWDGKSESHTAGPGGGLWTDMYAGNIPM
jgi:hypothetical protein